MGDATRHNAGSSQRQSCHERLGPSGTVGLCCQQAGHLQAEGKSRFTPQGSVGEVFSVRDESEEDGGLGPLFLPADGPCPTAKF